MKHPRVIFGLCSFLGAVAVLAPTVGARADTPSAPYVGSGSGNHPDVTSTAGDSVQLSNYSAVQSAYNSSSTSADEKTRLRYASVQTTTSGKIVHLARNYDGHIRPLSINCFQADTSIDSTSIVGIPVWHYEVSQNYCYNTDQSRVVSVDPAVNNISVYYPGWSVNNVSNNVGTVPAYSVGSENEAIFSYNPLKFVTFETQDAHIHFTLYAGYYDYNWYVTTS